MAAILKISTESEAQWYGEYSELGYDIDFLDTESFGGGRLISLDDWSIHPGKHRSSLDPVGRSSALQ